MANGGCEIVLPGPSDIVYLHMYYCGPGCGKDYRTYGSLHNYPSFYNGAAVFWWQNFGGGQPLPGDNCSEIDKSKEWRTSGTSGALTDDERRCVVQAHGYWGIGITYE